MTTIRRLYDASCNEEVVGGARRATCRLLYPSRLLVSSLCALCVSLSVSVLVVCVFFVVCLGRLSISLSYRFDRFYICVVVVVVSLYLLSRGRPRTLYFVVFVSCRTHFFRTVSSVEIPIDPQFGGSCGSCGIK